MAFSAQDVSIVTRAPFRAIGMKIPTSMETAHEDCSNLWYKDFGPRMPEVCSAYQQNESFGISFLTDAEKGTFDYWAAVAAPETAPVLQGLGSVAVPGGTFLELLVPSLEELAGAYTYLFSQWLPSHKEYLATCTVPCYELYKADFMQTGHITLYFPVEKA